MTKGLVRIDHFTDVACPFAFSAEPDLLALRWHYGDQLDWNTRFVVLSEQPGEAEAKGITIEMISANDGRLAREHGMPIDSSPRPHLLVARPVDLVAKGVELNDPENADRFVRALRVAWMTDHRPVDDPAIALDVAEECGLDRESVARWRDDPATGAALDADKDAARSPLAAALGALDHKLGGPEEERRYTCPSIEVSSGANPELRMVAPGFQSINAYEVILANVAPQLDRRPAAGDPLEVLLWAQWPLSAAEVARVMDVDRERAQTALAEAGAVEDRGYWSAPSDDEHQLAAGSAAADRFVSGSGVG